MEINSLISLIILSDNIIIIITKYNIENNKNKKIKKLYDIYEIDRKDKYMDT